MRTGAGSLTSGFAQHSPILSVRMTRPVVEPAASPEQQGLPSALLQQAIDLPQ